MAFLRWALVTVPLVLLLGLASGILSRSGYGNVWFALLAKPVWMPPGWVFGMAWTVCYVLMGLALAFVLSARGARWRKVAIGLFVLQLALNLAWSPLFFGAHKIDAALILILVLGVLVVLTIWCSWRVRPLAGVLMLPYLAWLLFAAYLNFTIGALNPGAEMLAPDGASTQITL